MLKRLSLTLLLFCFSFSALSHARNDYENADILSNIRIDGIANDTKDSSKSIVLINGIAFHEGDVYKKHTIRKISADSIILVNNTTNATYELSPGDGKANVQKRETANGAKNKSVPAPAAPKPEAKPGEMPSLLEAYANPLKTVENVKAQIDQIKADRDKRDEELNKLFQN